MKYPSFALLLLLPFLVLQLRVWAKPVFSYSAQITANQAIDSTITPHSKLDKLPVDSLDYVQVEMKPKKDSFTLSYHLSLERDPETNDPVRKKAVSILVGGAKTFMSPRIVEYMGNLTARERPSLQSDYVIWDYPGKNMNRKSGKFDPNYIKASLVALIENMSQNYDIINLYGVCFGAGPVLETLSENDFTNTKQGFKINAYIISGYSSKMDFNFEKTELKSKAIDYFLNVTRLGNRIGKMVKEKFWFDPISKIESLRVDDIFIIHGDRDTLVDTSRMKAFAKELTELGHSVYYKEAYDGGHELDPNIDVAPYLRKLEKQRNKERQKIGDYSYVYIDVQAEYFSESDLEADFDY